MRPIHRALLTAGLLCLPALLPAQASLIILVRHAEKTADAADPGLTDIGERRAEDLAEALQQVRLTAIITTQYRRSRLTTIPVSRAQRVTPIVVPAGAGLQADAQAVAAALDSLPAGSAALVVGHSNTLGAIIAALGGPAVADLCDDEYSTLLVLERPGGGQAPRLVRSQYGVAGPAGGPTCRS